MSHSSHFHYIVYGFLGLKIFIHSKVIKIVYIFLLAVMGWIICTSLPSSSPLLFSPLPQSFPVHPTGPPCQGSWKSPEPHQDVACPQIHSWAEGCEWHPEERNILTHPWDTSQAWACSVWLPNRAVLWVWCEQLWKGSCVKAQFLLPGRTLCLKV